MHATRFNLAVKDRFQSLYKTKLMGVLVPKYTFMVEAFKSREEMHANEQPLLVYCKKMLGDKFPDERAVNNSLDALEEFI